MATITGEAKLYNAVRIFLADSSGVSNFTTTSSLTANVGRLIKFDRTQQQLIESTVVGEGEFSKRGISASLNTSFGLRHYHPTFMRIDIERLGIPEGTDIVFQMEEDFVKEQTQKYPSARGYKIARDASLYTLRTPKLFASNLETALSVSPLPLRIKQLSSTISDVFDSTVTGFFAPGVASAMFVDDISLSSAPVKTARVSTFNPCAMVDVFYWEDNAGFLIEATRNLPISFDLDSDALSRGDFRIRETGVNNFNSTITMPSVDATRFPGFVEALEDEVVMNTSAVAVYSPVIHLNMFNTADVSTDRERRFSASLTSTSTVDVSKIDDYPWEFVYTSTTANDINPIGISSWQFAQQLDTAGDALWVKSDTKLSVYDIRESSIDTYGRPMLYTSYSDLYEGGQYDSGIYSQNLPVVADDKRVVYRVENDSFGNEKWVIRSVPSYISGGSEYSAEYTIAFGERPPSYPAGYQTSTLHRPVAINNTNLLTIAENRFLRVYRFNQNSNEITLVKELDFQGSYFVPAPYPEYTDASSAEVRAFNSTIFAMRFAPNPDVPGSGGEALFTFDDNTTRISTTIPRVDAMNNEYIVADGNVYDLNENLLSTYDTNGIVIQDVSSGTPGLVVSREYEYTYNPLPRWIGTNNSIASGSTVGKVRLPNNDSSHISVVSDSGKYLFVAANDDPNNFYDTAEPRRMHVYKRT